MPANLIMAIPFLTQADDLLFELHGGPRKAPGAAKINSSALESGAAIRTAYDAWFSGTSGTPSQRRIVEVGTTLKADAADGTFANISTGRSADSISCYAMLDDFAVIASSTEALSKWDGTTFSAVSGGSPTNIKCICEHKGFLFGGGASAAPSALRYTDQFTPNTWSGTIQVSPDDGDGIMAVASHRGELIIFKGPYKGSIWRLTGSSSSDFALVPFAKGLGAAGPNLVRTFGGDLAFVDSDANIYTLSATDKYGDYADVSLTRQIGSWLRDNATFSQLAKGSLSEDSGDGILIYTLPAEGSSVPNTVITVDYRFQPPRISRHPSLTSKGYSVAHLVDASDSNRHKVMLGGSDGYLRKWGQSVRTIDASTAIGMRLTTPFLSYGTPWQMKTFQGGSLAIANRSGGTIEFGWQGLTGSYNSTPITEGGAGALLDAFLLDTDSLANVSFGDRFFELDAGDFRAIQFSIGQGTSGQDCEVFAFTAKIEGNADSTRNDEG
ncbi:MAG: hypothetical protein WA210_14365 [Burkholderiaceae bacterium]